MRGSVENLKTKQQNNNELSFETNCSSLSEISLALQLLIHTRVESYKALALKINSVTNVLKTISCVTTLIDTLL